ncbi:MAG: ribosome silencing factor [Bacteroidetes bacterium]|nr:ribosome silencing factor [Bacteroidota bacterium]
MARGKKNNETGSLVEAVVEAIYKRKGRNILGLNLEKIPNAVCKYFIICDGTSITQVSAIAESIDGEVKKKLGVDPWHSEGYENAEWILLDYVDVVVHIFQEKTRSFYRLEELWADAKMKKYRSEE